MKILWLLFATAVLMPGCATTREQDRQQSLATDKNISIVEVERFSTIKAEKPSGESLKFDDLDSGCRVSLCIL